MKVTLWGTRGSLASPGDETARFGGNTSSVEVRGDDGTILILDAGTGVRRLGGALPRPLRRVDILLTHLHMDHIQGLGFFTPLFDPKVEAHVWGPASLTLDLRSRLMRYLSPPFFPVHLRELPCDLHLHEIPCEEVTIGSLRVATALVCHPGPTVGCRVSDAKGTFAYLPDHEPALGARRFPEAAEWTSGYDLAAGVDLLVHDAQYRDDEYAARVGWGHSTIDHCLAFAALAGVRHLVPFHHDPDHDDDELERLVKRAAARAGARFTVTPGTEGAVFEPGAS